MDKQHTCNKCNKPFKRKYNLKLHNKVHLKKVDKLVCPICGKLYINLGNFRVHMRKHHTEYEVDEESLEVVSVEQNISHISK